MTYTRFQEEQVHQKVVEKTLDKVDEYNASLQDGCSHPYRCEATTAR